MSATVTHSMTRAGLFHRPCGQNRYADKKAAVSEINRLKKVRGRHGRPLWLRAYPCPDCNGWHITKGIDRELAAVKGAGIRTGAYIMRKART